MGDSGQTKIALYPSARELSHMNYLHHLKDKICSTYPSSCQLLNTSMSDRFLRSKQCMQVVKAPISIYFDTFAKCMVHVDSNRVTYKYAFTNSFLLPCLGGSIGFCRIVEMD